MIDNEEELPGEDELFDLWLEAERRAVELADKVELTDEQLQRLVSRWENLGKEGEEHPLSHLAKHVLTIRSLRQIVGMMRPDEEMVPLVELAARYRQGKGEA